MFDNSAIPYFGSLVLANINNKVCKCISANANFKAISIPVLLACSSITSLISL